MHNVEEVSEKKVTMTYKKYKCLNIENILKDSSLHILLMSKCIEPTYGQVTRNVVKLYNIQYA